jgi:hypothetical protein
MLPTQAPAWDLALGPHADWKDAYAFVEERVKYLFDKLGNPRRFGTDELVEFLYPLDRARGPGITARKRIYTALRALAKHQLAAYCEPGQPRPLKHNPKKLVTPLIWRAPAAEAREDSPFAVELGDAIRTAPLGNEAREALARYLQKTLRYDAAFVERCMGWAPTIGNVGL